MWGINLLKPVTSGAASEAGFALGADSVKLHLLFTKTSCG